jgi:SMI1-KNR4 cell-wall
MISVQVTGAKPPPSAALIEQVERAVGYSIPPTFLSSFAGVHGGEPGNNTFAIGDGIDSGVNEFIEFGSIPEEYESGGFQELGEYLPIAFAEGGNYVCVKVTEPNRGAIFFWDHEIASPTRRLRPLAESLESFLGLLRPFDPKSVVLEKDQVIDAWIDPEFLRAMRGDRR